MAPASVVETHVSTLLLTGDRVYKLLKPVELPFLDHRSVRARLAAVDREIELNRRLSPDVYLGSADVVEDGDVVDRMIVMRRLPETARLSIAVKGSGAQQCVRAVARAVAVFHASQPAVVDAPMADRDAVAQNWEDNLATIQRFRATILPAGEVDRVAALAREYLVGHEKLFDRRVRDGYIRDGHGDLTAEDIYCLDDGPRILDCLAFRDDLRIGDVLLDVAFLAMDLHRLAGAETAARFMAWYREFSGERHPASLAHHYVAYRAHVRAKIACLRHEQGVPGEDERARRYHQLCLHHLERARVSLVMIGGGPAAGKSRLAAELGGRLGWVHLSTDEIRRNRVDLVGEGSGPEPLDSGRYAPAARRAVYLELISEARALVARGESVILDASWADDTDRALARELAAECDAQLVEVEVVVDRDTALARAAVRDSADVDASEATAAHVDALREGRDRWPEAHRLDGRGTFEQVADAFARYLVAERSART